MDGKETTSGPGCPSNICWRLGQFTRSCFYISTKNKEQVAQECLVELASAGMDAVRWHKNGSQAGRGGAARRGRAYMYSITDELID